MRSKEGNKLALTKTQQKFSKALSRVSLPLPYLFELTSLFRPLTPTAPMVT